MPYSPDPLPLAERSRWISPRELHFSLGAPGLPPGLPHRRPEKGSTARQAPLMRFAAPSALEDESVHQPRPYLSRFVPTSPFLTTSPVCSALVRPGISPGGTHGVLLPCRVAPASHWATPSPASPSPPDLASAAPPSRGLPVRGPFACCFGVPSGSVYASRPYPACFGFPLRRGADPLLGFFFGTSLPLPPEGLAAVRPRHVPTCQ